jgi:hypothetical protein
VWAKAVAGATHDFVAKHALQVCGAMGLSDEHPLPALVRRGFSLDALLSRSMEQDVGFGGDIPQPVGGSMEQDVGFGGDIPQPVGRY